MAPSDTHHQDGEREHGGGLQYRGGCCCLEGQPDSLYIHRRTEYGEKRLKEDRGWRAEARGGQRMVSRGQRRTEDGEKRLKEDREW